VYNLSDRKYVIDNQNTDVLKVIMRSIFLQFSNFQFENIEGQVSEINETRDRLRVTTNTGEKLRDI